MEGKLSSYAAAICVIGDVRQLLSEMWEGKLEMCHLHHVVRMQNRKGSGKS